jgi:CheY-like chemotaxis protein
MSERSVMVVDDDYDIRTVVGELLRLEGYRVLEARDGSDALGRLDDAGKPDLILLDLTMPRMNGLEFRQRQQADPRLAGIPVVLMSAMPGLGGTAAKVGAAGYLSKPVRLPALLRTVADVIASC